MQNRSKPVLDDKDRKRHSNAGLENNPPNKMGKQNRTNYSNVRKRSPENILKDIKELKQKRAENCVEEASEGHVTWQTETTHCPPTDPAIPQRALDQFIRHLSHENKDAEKLVFWRRQYDESMADEPVEIEDDFEALARCPVCQQELPKNQIETHADECAAKMFEN